MYLCYSQVYAALVALKYNVTNINVKTLFHPGEDLVEVTVITTVTVVQDPAAVIMLKLTIRKINGGSNSTQPLIIDNLTVTGYLPSGMLLCVNTVLLYVIVYLFLFA